MYIRNKKLRVVKVIRTIIEGSAFILMLGIAFMFGYYGYVIDEDNKFDVFNIVNRVTYIYQEGTNLSINLEATNLLLDAYNKSGKNEYSGCLVGYIKNGTAYITSFENYTLGNETSVSYISCDSSYQIGHIHKHPNGPRDPSHSDVFNSFRGVRFHNIPIDIIHFGECNLSVRTKNDWFYGFNYVLNQSESIW